MKFFFFRNSKPTASVYPPPQSTANHHKKTLQSHHHSKATITQTHHHRPTNPANSRCRPQPRALIRARVPPCCPQPRASIQARVPPPPSTTSSPPAPWRDGSPASLPPAWKWTGLGSRLVHLPMWPGELGLDWSRSIRRWYFFYQIIIIIVYQKYPKFLPS